MCTHKKHQQQQNKVSITVDWCAGQPSIHKEPDLTNCNYDPLHSCSLSCNLTHPNESWQKSKEGKKKYLKAPHVPGGRRAHFDVSRKNISCNGNTQEAVNTFT